ncbi:hypothetical protein [Mycobacteroides abscessus]|uniref:hypothetical protein n=1 Tax=Mycobacteroides abscessus TaxID=36809 RepID=UPI000C263ABA|nr:hypothetical protein [Mycobacteroides abscessus]
MTIDEAKQDVLNEPLGDVVALAVGYLVAMRRAEAKYDCRFDDLPAPLLEFLDDMEKAAVDYLDSER